MAAFVATGPLGASASVLHPPLLVAACSNGVIDGACVTPDARVRPVSRLGDSEFGSSGRAKALAASALVVGTLIGVRQRHLRRLGTKAALPGSDAARVRGGAGANVSSSSRGRRTATSAVAQSTVTAPPSTRGIRNLPQSAPPSSAPAWREKFWFPVASVRELDPMRPTPLRIDGLDLVVWRVPVDDDGEEQWRVFADACPHRLAPLSEGRIEPKTGCLQCAYHGWEFDGGGACTRIPQVEEEAGQRMRQNPRSGAITFPTEVALSVIWVWLGEGPPQGHPGDLIGGSYLEEQEVFTTYTRDLPYGYDALLENLLDVSHIPFAHHGLQGDRTDAAPISMTVPEVDQSHQPDVIRFDFKDRTMGMNREASFFLRSPFFFFYDGRFVAEEGATEEYKKFAARRGVETDGKVPFRLNVICVPVGPGYSRLILLSAKKKGADVLLAKLPMWLSHVLSNRFLDSDLAFLHFQERNLRRAPGGADRYQDGYFMPGECDRSIGAWRRWLATEGARCVTEEFAQHLPTTPLRRDELLDRYTQHTAHCAQCRKALADFDIWQQALGATGVAALVLERLNIGPAPVCLAIEVLAIAVIFALERLKKEFFFVDYEHYKT